MVVVTWLTTIVLGRKVCSTHITVLTWELVTGHSMLGSAYVVCMAMAWHQLCSGSRPIFTRELVTGRPRGGLWSGLGIDCVLVQDQISHGN